jgi:hypothetical protein
VEQPLSGLWVSVSDSLCAALYERPRGAA